MIIELIVGGLIALAFSLAWKAISEWIHPPPSASVRAASALARSSSATDSQCALVAATWLMVSAHSSRSLLDEVTIQADGDFVAEARKIWDDPKWARGTLAISVVAKVLLDQGNQASADYSTDLPMILGPDEHFYDLADRIVDRLNILGLEGPLDLPAALVSVAGALGRALHEDVDAEAFWSVCDELNKVFPQISWHTVMTDNGSKTFPFASDG